MENFIRKMHRDGVPREKPPEEPTKIEEESHEVLFDRLTSCHECRERLKPPIVMLPCAHNLCQVCCQKIIDNKSLAIKNSRNGGRRMRCPACRKEVVLDMHGVHSLPRNSGAEKMIASIEKWHKDVREGNQIKKRQPKKRKYIIPNCPVKDHYNQKLNIYCRSCQVLTCTLCKCFGPHEKCNVIPLADATQEDKVCIKSELKRLEDLLARYNAVIKLYDDLQKKRTDNAKAARLRVIDIFQKLNDVLKERQTKMLKEIQQDLQSRLIKYDNYLDRCGEILHEQTDLAAEACRVLSAKNWVGFIERARDETTPKVVKFCDQRAKFLAQPLEEELHCTDHYNVDFSKATESLENLGFSLN